ncbi:MAG: alpha/beta hydrolase [Bdellovibrionales bacterium CG12_big_fil_rev_8_21_14_0_65_38_15]|nr:MAG: alpha/beta hydrolase [Bdellovibrionales bacterium CG22_combo_CG10-13_8_21_14_all_38_13]PIQ56318.1 MAG: alpha/beta hydrolase [Bdellovibrionales bacterium CG12_big_fil_rev_8_21_14_0_65_38_15]PIR29349.1 MAG: alpha/beta hydrolase [Bdellovibrionales bacterium CG11_big_fil_rev_8_21_14_0_20_38_13]
MRFLLPFLFLIAACSTLKPTAKNLSYSEDLREMDYPYNVQYFDIQTHKMAFMDVAAKAKYIGVVVLFHGKNFNGSYWHKTADDLSKAGFRVIIPDQLGFGKSDKPIDYQYSFHALASNTAQLLDSLKLDKVSIVGHSMGGMLAARFALMYPQRVSKLSLVNPIGLEDWKRVVPYTPLDKRIEGELKQTRESIIDYQRKSYYDGNWKPEYEVAAAHLIGWAQGPDKQKIATVSALTYEMVFTQPVLYEFNLLSMPTLLIIGERDRTAIGKNLVSKEVGKDLGRYDLLGQKTCNKISKCEIVHLKSIGHLPQIEAYSEYIRALKAFLI